MTRAPDRSSGPRLKRTSLDGPVEPGSFLEKRSYRRRRKTDGLRLLPVLGLWLFMVPLLWPGASARLTGLGVPMSTALIYIFAVWFALIVLCAFLSATQNREDTDRTGETALPPPTDGR
jgi:hypothetical protein